jgi:hypothetical protein
MEMLLVAAFILAIALGVYSAMRGAPPRFCTACGHLGKPRMRTQGSLLIEIALWIAFIVPGVIYSIWRHTTRGEVCEACGAANLIPPDSPVALKMRKDLGRSV